ncbi:unnamed protein product [Effrenium voratum]|nr:unnamed protein product [Effrenium voratum]
MGDSAHCLNFDSLWYSVYEVSQPQIFYDITVRLRTPDDYESGWGNVTYSETTMTLSQQQPVVASAGGQLRAELVGDLATAVAPQRFESKYLAVPSRPAGHERVDASQPLRTAMLLDRSLFDLSGRTCDKIGVSFTAFRYQPEACNRPAGSCLFSQLENFYLQDLARAQSGQSPMYMVDGFCEGGMELAPGSGGQIFLACPLAQRHTTLLRLEARADQAMFVTNVASGRIVSAEVAAFQALAENGEAEVMVLNTGAILADFTLGLRGGSGLKAAFRRAGLPKFISQVLSTGFALNFAEAIADLAHQDVIERLLAQEQLLVEICSLIRPSPKRKVLRSEERTIEECTNESSGSREVGHNYSTTSVRDLPIQKASNYASMTFSPKLPTFSPKLFSTFSRFDLSLQQTAAEVDAQLNRQRFSEDHEELEKGCLGPTQREDESYEVGSCPLAMYSLSQKLATFHGFLTKWTGHWV